MVVVVTGLLPAVYKVMGEVPAKALTCSPSRLGAIIISIFLMW